MLEKNPGKYAVSLAVLGGGCAGFKYDWGFADTKEECSRRRPREDWHTGRFVVDETSMMYVMGTKIDWVEETFGSQFEISNPNSTSHVVVENLWCIMDTAFIIGNGESRNIFPIENLKGNGMIYGCNAIYRDHPMLCDHIVAVNPPMYEELAKWHNNGKESPSIHGIDDISKWNYICEGDHEHDVPEGLKIYRYGVAVTSRKVAR